MEIPTEFTQPIHTWQRLRNSIMSEWHCFKCKEKMELAEITLSWYDIEQDIEGIKCPKCGTSYLLEDKVIGEITEQERMLEDK